LLINLLLFEININFNFDFDFDYNSAEFIINFKKIICNLNDPNKYFTLVLTKKIKLEFKHSKNY
jgi:hypothetical protein